MAGNNCFPNSGECTLAANTAKTLLQIKAPTNQRLTLKTLRLLGKMPAGGTDPVVKIRLTRSTANFGTATGTMTPGKQNPSNGETLQGTYSQNFTTEPTSPSDSGLWLEVQPQAGIIEPLSIDQWIDIPGGQAVNVEATSSGTPVLLVSATVEE